MANKRCVLTAEDKDYIYMVLHDRRSDILRGKPEKHNDVGVKKIERIMRKFECGDE